MKLRGILPTLMTALTSIRQFPLGDGRLRAQLHLLMGVEALEAGEVESAMTHLEQAVESQPQMGQAWVALGMAQEAARGKLAGIDSLREGARLSPASADAQLIYGSAALDAGLMEEAIPALKSALDLSPALAGAHYSLGVALLECADLDSALIHLTQAIQLDPELGEAHYGLATTLALIQLRDVTGLPEA